MTSSNGNIFRVTGLCAGNSPVAAESPTKGQWRGALMFSLICAQINGWVNNCEAVGLRRHRTHYDAIVLSFMLKRDSRQIPQRQNPQQYMLFPHTAAIIDHTTWRKVASGLLNFIKCQLYYMGCYIIVSRFHLKGTNTRALIQYRDAILPVWEFPLRR